MFKTKLPKILLASVLSLSMFTYGCSVDQFKSILNQVAPAITTILQIVALFTNKPADLSPATKIAADVAAIEQIYDDWKVADAASKPGVRDHLDAAFSVLNLDLNIIFNAAQISNQQTQAKLTVLIGLIEAAVRIAQSAFPSNNVQVGNPANLTAKELLTSWNKSLTAKTGDKVVDEYTNSHKMHVHGVLLRTISLGEVK